MEELKKGTEIAETAEAVETMTSKTLKLSKPFVFEGETYTEFNFDFDSLTGNDFIEIETEMNDLNEYALTPETSPNFCARLAAKAAGVNASVIKGFPLKDFNKAKNLARSFLTSMD